MQDSRPIIGISVGDIQGIGPEVILKTFADPRMLEWCTPVVFSSEQVLQFYRKIADAQNMQWHVMKSMGDAQEGKLNVFACWDEALALEPGKVNDLGGKYAVRSLQVAAQCLKDGELDALVTAPLHKANTQLPGFAFTGHTPFLKAFFEAEDVVMLLHCQDLRVGLLTEHIPIHAVGGAITQDMIIRKANLLSQSLQRDFAIHAPRIALLGLNPHAGDEGQIGIEEQTTLIPALEALRSKGLLVFGPYPADAFFARSSWKSFDAVLACYHDQGLVPFKTLAAGHGVNYTAGLPVIRTSPDHGTAMDIAGQGLADPDSFREAVFAAIDRVKERAVYDAATSNPLERRAVKKERIR